MSEQQFGSSVQEMEIVSNLTAKAPMDERGHLFSSCVPVLVKRLDQDKNADENADADLVRTGRPVESEQSIGLFTQGEDRVIDFRVCGLPHAVVKKAENFSVRELVRKIESHPQRRERQADFLQPIQWRTKVMNREMGNVKLFELCETIPKMQCSEWLLSWNQGMVYCTCVHLLVEQRHQEGATSRW